jgi:predicted CXXCH cytochrome family protein
MNGTLRTWGVRAAIAAVAAMAAYPALTEMTGGAPFLPPVEPQTVSLREDNSLESPHGPEPLCAACHRAHTAVSEQLLVADGTDLSICTRCHSPGGAKAVSTHGNIDFPYATEAPFAVSCTACHDPHGDPGSGNRAMIRANIAGYDVRFLHESGEDSYDDGLDDGIVDSLCVVCHTATSHNNVYSAELQGEGHGPVGSDCTSCHRHGNDPALRSAFLPDQTATPTPSPTPLPTETPSPTSTPLPTDTPAPTETPAPTATPAPTDTPSAEPSPSP